MKIKHLLAPLLAIILLTGCTAKQSPEPGAETIRVAALKGPTAMGMARLMERDELGEAAQDYDFILGVIDEILPLVSRGEADIAAVPANIAAVLYNNLDGAVKVAAINTLGVLYIVEKGDTISSAADLKGRTLYATGKGATPEFALRYILSQYGLDPDRDVTIEFRSEPTEILPLLEQTEDGIAVLPQPFVVSALRKVARLRIALDLTAEWSAVPKNDSGLVTGVLIVNTAFAEENPDALAAFLAEYADSASYANESVSETAALVEKYGIVAADIAAEALPYCNITCITGAEMKTKLGGYLEVIHGENPESVGGALPDDRFYFDG